MRKTCGIAGVVSVAWVALLTVLLAAESGVQPPPPPPPGPPQIAQGETKPPTGTGKITGIAVATDNGAPVKRASVMLTGGTPTPAGRASASLAAQVVVNQGGGGRGLTPGLISRRVQTDATGRFEFAGLPAGRYALFLNATGGFSQTATESVELADGGSATVTFKLERTGAIAGKVFDETGDPVQNAMLRLSRWVSNGGTRRLSPFYGNGGGFTDDLGAYRFYNLPPGEYFVSASVQNFVPGLQDDGADTKEPRVGLAPTFYPGTTSLASAQPVTVRSAQDTPGIDITLQRATMGRVVATVADAGGGGVGAPPRVNVGISSKLEAVAFGSGMSQQRDGTYRSADLPPGDYYVWATSQRNEGQTSMPEGAVVPVTINGDEVAVHLQMNAGATVSGRVVIEGKMPDPMPSASGRGGAAASGLSVGVRPVVSGGYMPATASGRGATPGADGSFELKGLRGTMRIMASAPRLALKSVRRGTQNILAHPLELNGTETITDLEIVLTSETGTLEGSATNASGEPAAGAFVIIFSQDPSQWYESSPYVRQLTTSAAIPRSSSPGGSQSAAAPGNIPGAIVGPVGSLTVTTSGGGGRLEPGRFSTPPLLPGSYAVVAIERSGTTTPAYDAEALEKLRARATSVTIKAGETARVDVKAIKQ